MTVVLSRPQMIPARAGRTLTVSTVARVQEKGAKHLRKSRPKKVSALCLATASEASSILPPHGAGLDANSSLCGSLEYSLSEMRPFDLDIDTLRSTFCLGAGTHPVRQSGPMKVPNIDISRLIVDCFTHSFEYIDLC